jgi:hypothetical protein
MIFWWLRGGELKLVEAEKPIVTRPSPKITDIFGGLYGKKKYFNSYFAKYDGSSYSFDIYWDIKRVTSTFPIARF